MSLQSANEILAAQSWGSGRKDDSVNSGRPPPAGRPPLPRPGWSRADIAAFGFVLICLASASGRMPAWVAKAGLLVLVIFPVCVLIGLFHSGRHAGRNDPGGPGCK